MIIRFFATLRNISGLKETTLPAPRNVQELLERLSLKYGDRFDREIWLYRNNEKQDLLPGVIILVNGKHYAHLHGLATPLEETDVVSFFPPVAGG